jgi:hypothetical protein
MLSFDKLTLQTGRELAQAREDYIRDYFEVAPDRWGSMSFEEKMRLMEGYVLEEYPPKYYTKHWTHHGYEAAIEYTFRIRPMTPEEKAVPNTTAVEP